MRRERREAEKKTEKGKRKVDKRQVEERRIEKGMKQWEKGRTEEEITKAGRRGV